MAAYDLPLGYEFEPSKEELVGYFLTRKLTGQPLESFHNDHIIDFDVYSHHPSKIMTLTKRKVEEDGFQQGYFFSSLETTSKNGKRIKRHIPTHGTWLEKAATKMICYQNEVIGIHKYYKFNPVSESKGSILNKHEWMMHEYSLLRDQDNQDKDMVLCHITNKKDYNNSHNKSIKARKINMVVDELLDYEAGPSKISRVDPYTAWNDEDPLNLISYDVGDHECATADGGVKDDESLKLFEDGYKSAMEQIVAQEDHHDGHQVIEIPDGEMAPIQAAAGELTWTTSNLDPRAQEELNRLKALLMA